LGQQEVMGVVGVVVKEFLHILLLRVVSELE
jgi:hypothetical protein